jgi:hypothetical protein
MIQGMTGVIAARENVAAWLHYVVLEIRKTEVFAHWLNGVRDVGVRARVRLGSRVR